MGVYIGIAVVIGFAAMLVTHYAGRDGVTGKCDDPFWVCLAIGGLATLLVAAALMPVFDGYASRVMVRNGVAKWVVDPKTGEATLVLLDGSPVKFKAWDAPE